MTKICICVCTYKRPHMLEALLGKLEEQTTAGEFTVSIVVVDNDRQESARSVVMRAAESMRVPVTYGVEPEQNIAKARNKALSLSTGDFIALIDDDEVPPRDWLISALHALLARQADGVLGPVRPLFRHRPPQWLVKGRFCERLEHRTGHVLRWRETRSGNALFRRGLVADCERPFSPAYGNGGEDHEFFKRLIEGGALFVWCNEAAIEEVVPRERCLRRYLLHRALLRGQNEKGFANARDILKSMTAVPTYLIVLPFMLFAGQHRTMQVLVRMCDHIGKLAAVLGFKPVGTTYLTSRSNDNGQAG